MPVSTVFFGGIQEKLGYANIHQTRPIYAVFFSGIQEKLGVKGYLKNHFAYPKIPVKTIC